MRPTAIVPSVSSANCAYAAPEVNAAIASSSVSFCAGYQPPAGSPDSFVLGELFRIEDAYAVALVSLGDARTISVRLQRALRPLNVDERVGIILGRAAAHEIGHYLLRTSTHARQGLMRARITDREFADPRANGFDLDSEAVAWLHSRSEMSAVSEVSAESVVHAAVTAFPFAYVP